MDSSCNCWNQSLTHYLSLSDHYNRKTLTRQRLTRSSKIWTLTQMAVWTSRSTSHWWPASPWCAMSSSPRSETAPPAHSPQNSSSCSMSEFMIRLARSSMQVQRDRHRHWPVHIQTYRLQSHEMERKLFGLFKVKNEINYFNMFGRKLTYHLCRCVCVCACVIGCVCPK